MPVDKATLSPALAAYAEATARLHAQAGTTPDTPPAASFADLLKDTLGDAKAAGQAGETQAIQAVAGKASLHDVVEAVNAAELSLQTVVAVRDRVISAYQDIIRMPI